MSDTNNIQDEAIKSLKDEEITRKQSIKKMGKYAAAATLFLVLSPKDSQAQSAAPPTPGWGED